MSPVVRLVYTYRSGKSLLKRTGTGFFAGRWRRALLTAAHVVRTHPGDTPHALAVHAFGRETRYRLFASAFAYPLPFGTRRDVAVVVLSRPVPRLSKTLPPSSAPSGDFHAELIGWTAAAGKGEPVPIVGRKHQPWVRYHQGSGDDGMSGGPLLWFDRASRREKVVASHVGEVADGDRFPAGFAISVPVVRACLEAADRAR